MAVRNDASVSDAANGDSCGIVDGSDCYFTDNGEKEMITVLLVWLALSVVCGLAFGKMCKWADGHD